MLHGKSCFSLSSWAPSTLDSNRVMIIPTKGVKEGEAWIEQQVERPPLWWHPQSSMSQPSQKGLLGKAHCVNSLGNREGQKLRGWDQNYQKHVVCFLFLQFFCCKCIASVNLPFSTSSILLSEKWWVQTPRGTEKRDDSTVHQLAHCWKNSELVNKVIEQMIYFSCSSPTWNWTSA